MTRKSRILRTAANAYILYRQIWSDHYRCWVDLPETTYPTRASARLAQINWNDEGSPLGEIMGHPMHSLMALGSR